MVRVEYISKLVAKAKKTLCIDVLPTLYPKVLNMRCAGHIWPHLARWVLPNRTWNHFLQEKNQSIR